MEPSLEQLKSEQLLAEVKRRQGAKNVVEVEEERVKLVIFACGDKKYAFYGSDIREILPACAISWVPGLPDYLPGLINVRGDIESVIDIRHFLGEEKVAGGKNLIAMAVKGDFRSGILIDAIEDVVDVPRNTIHSPLSTLNAALDLVIGEIDYGGTMVTLLDIEKMAAKISL
jgi:purine-binding chemotaxis protein CheW